MDEQSATLLIVEDDLDIAEMLASYFRVEGYTVLTANWGEDGVDACTANLPDLVILDIRLPDIDGFEVARRLKGNRRTSHIPLIFLTEKRERGDRLRGLELRAEDYITKPFDMQELRLRVRNSLLRSRRSSLTNPITAIPQGDLVDERLRPDCLSAGQRLVIVSLDNLDRFREVYGFVASDDLLRAVALMLRDALADLEEKEAFLGHLTQTEFVIITRSAHLHEVTDQLRKRLEQSFDYFYRHQDREANLFSGRGLAVAVTELPPDYPIPPDVEQLKRELARLHRRGEE